MANRHLKAKQPAKVACFYAISRFQKSALRSIHRGCV